MPKTGVVAGVYVQAISAYAPHPNAAKLWMEYLYSDEGQLGWLKGYCHPIRFNDLAKSGEIPQDLLDKLPPAAAYEAAVFPTLDEQAAAKDSHHRRTGTRSSAPTSSSYEAPGGVAPPGSYLATGRSRHDRHRRIRRQPTAPRRRRRRAACGCRLNWLGVAPFFIFAAAVPDPADDLPDRSAPSRTPAGEFTLENIVGLSQPSIVAAYWISIKISLASALLGALIGLAIAIAIVRGGLPSWIRSATLTFSGVASNFAGVPLAFAFLATLGRLGLVTVLLRHVFGIDIYALRLQPPLLLGPDAHLPLSSRSR